jgi:stage III sporulation protein AB
MKSRALIMREAALAAWLHALETLAAQISYSDDGIADILSASVSEETEAERNLAAVFREASANMKCSKLATLAESLPREWSQNLTAQDKAILLPIINRIGSSERYQQLRELEGAKQALAAQTQAAASRTAREKRLYSTLGTLGGLALFLFLIG